MSITVIIPARYGSTRLAAKALLDRTGKPMVQHVWEAVRAAKLPDRVFIATDDERIQRAARSFGADVVMTSPDCASGTDRVAEAMRQVGGDVVINVQGDEPEMPSSAVDAVARLLQDDPTAPMATLAAPWDEADDPANPNRVKVVVDASGDARYFSRAAIPHQKAGGATPRRLRHVGIYGFRSWFLAGWSRLPASDWEATEGLEQLRALQAGARIRVGLVERGWPGIDTEEDYLAFVARYRG